MAARARLKPVEFSPTSPLGAVRYELGRIQAAMYLVDQIEHGDLSRLVNQPPTFTCWDSHCSLMPEDLADHLRHMVYREVAGALKDADAALRAAAATPSRGEGLDGGRA